MFIDANIYVGAEVLVGAYIYLIYWIFC
jgi:hypothetical protein